MTFVLKHSSLWALICLGVFILGSTIQAQAEEKMIFEEWQGLLDEYKNREEKANRELVALERQQINDLKKQITDKEKQIALAKKEIQDLLGATESQVEVFKSRLESLEARITALERLSKRTELAKRMDEIDGVIATLNEMKSSRITILPGIIAKIDELKSRLDALKKAAGIPMDYYTVVRGDCLWRISDKKSIYGDPCMWLRLYRSNRDQIKNPDLIFPKQVLKVPQGVPQGFHLVVRGENLSKIAGYSSVYNDRSKWLRIYEANRDQIKNPNVIYPALLLKIPE